jgi:dTDP-4-dehydrorhamnose 3,5-epimerase
MKLTPTSIRDVVVIEPNVFQDERGWFMETFNEQRFHTELLRLGLPVPGGFVQDNHSSSAAGVLRGLHYQAAPSAQGKLVRVTRGAAFDVAVDIRQGSRTRGEWVGIELTEANRRMVWIPEGFAHGFLALEADTQLVYKTTNVYDRASERSIRWDDKSLGIAWPVERCCTGTPLLSDKDAKAEPFG